MSPLILVTGCSGFIGCEIALSALEQGSRVRGAVRREEQGELFFERYPSIPREVLEFVVVENMCKEGAWDEAVEGVDYVVHTASPVSSDCVVDRAKNMLDPAINGTLNLLRAALKVESVKTLVMTSSSVAFMDFKNPKGADEEYTEFDWNPMNYEEAADPNTFKSHTYAASKALAERAALAFVRENNAHFGLVTVAPTWVLGPSRQPGFRRIADAPPTLADTWASLVDSPTPMPPSPFPHFVDVRDVALVHLAALTHPAAHGKRFILAGGRFSNDVASQILASEFPEQAGRLQLGGDLDFGETYDWADSFAAEDILGIEYTRFGKTIRDMGEQFFALPK
ncbi:hypothetical protein P7C70_g1536, partial [Phenoliferia sp. Uapishka_3]